MICVLCGGKMGFFARIFNTHKCNLDSHIYEYNAKYVFPILTAINMPKIAPVQKQEVVPEALDCGKSTGAWWEEGADHHEDEEIAKEEPSTCNYDCDT